MSAARAAARVKPVVVMKAGRHAEGAKAAASHTGALAGADEVYDAAFRRAGMLRVTTLSELFAAVEILSSAPRIRGDRLAIVTNGGGFGVLATDELMDVEGRLAELAPETMAKLDAALPATWSRGNPIDIIGDAPGSRYVAALEALADDPNVDAALALNCPTAISSSVEAAEAVAGAAKAHPRLPLICAWIGDSAEARAAREKLDDQGLPVYATPGEATRAFMYLVRHRRSQEELMQTPPAEPETFKPDLPAARAAIASALAQQREWLTEPEAKAVLAAYQIPIAKTVRAATPEEAMAAAERIGFPVALKILSPDITHKSDMGGVALDLDSAAAVAEAARSMLERIRAAAPKAKLEGFTVQQMIRRPGAIELILGIADDRQFGPVVLFGQGGVAVEVIKDKALALPPLNMALAHDLIGRTRVAGLLRGYRDRPPADLDQVALALIKVAQIAADLPEVRELDVNPLLADRSGVIALDARVRVRPAEAPGAARLAIRPYPGEIEEEIEAAGRRFLLRPIRPEDEPKLQEAFRRLSPGAVRMRFFAPMKDLTHALAARLTQIDYDREMALVLTEPAPAGQADIFAVVRIAADPDNERAEFAVTVLDSLAGRGVGTLLMQKIIAYARKRGVGEIFGLILRDNLPMLEIASRLGFTMHEAELEYREARLALRP
jgi:acetyltransferase